ncbi:zinc-finger homeodomain protein 5-like [Punica granatum]|uniref:Uncharacterized protein n=2 Tax=Punica granatum TaxID=22663 RepID=A0A218WR10_PUNGR|nr:zinc-finger homeodomain protein 5-like [Punica granatum]XP_031406996.1 zinc-finger homeodomain protein 5-like [Punica granatum]OWM75063.1 hypothetical protein CDL15_Pgr021414 [Punica granatum]PKI45146.1 hypothetical protein CRG98_034450 [Punica granatum]
MEASGGGGRGGDHRSRTEALGLHNGAGAALFGHPHHHQTLADPTTDAVDRPNPNNNNTATNSSSSNPDPVSFAFAAASSPGPPSMTSPPSSAAPKSGKHQPTSSSVRYRECRRNHAASVGGSILDGCGEFMPAGEEGTIEALRCAACDCHRNFHRRETDADPSPLASAGPGAYRRGAGMSLATLQLSAPPPPPVIHHHHGHGGTTRPPPPYASLSIVPPMSVAFGGGGGTESSSEDLNLFGATTPTGHGHGHHHNLSSGGGYFGSSSSKSSKRFRTKFSQEQKERMQEFAEKIGWRIQRPCEDEVERFCAEVGVKRQVFKVWMHNNKNATKSANKQQQTPTADHEVDHDRQED